MVPNIRVYLCVLESSYKNVGDLGLALRVVPLTLPYKPPLNYCQYLKVNIIITRGQSNLTKSASRGAHSPVRGHPRGSKIVPLNSWGRVSY